MHNQILTLLYTLCNMAFCFIYQIMSCLSINGPLHSKLTPVSLRGE